jgi:hypothetical protein
MKHPKLIKIDQLTARITELQRELIDEERDAARLLPKADHTAYVWETSCDADGFTLFGTLRDSVANADKEHIARYGHSRVNPPEKTRRSVRYVRNEYGVLMHEGGGWLLLKDGMPVDGADWYNMRRGDVPKKFWR